MTSHAEVTRRARQRGLSVKSMLAIEQYEAAVVRNPDDPDAHAGLGWWWHAARQYGKALDHLDTALRLHPNHLRALCSRADLKATCPDASYRDGPAAVSDAARALSIADARGDLATEWKYRNHLEILACAYAETGDFDTAVKLMQSALEFSITHRGRRIIEARLSQFEAKKPVRSRMDGG